MQQKLYIAAALVLLATVVIGGIFVVRKRSQVAAGPLVAAEPLFPGLYRIHGDQDQQAYVNDLMHICYAEDQASVARIQCFKSLGKLLVNQFQFKDLVSALQNSGQDCHIAMHYTVNAEYQKGATIPEIWNQCTTACFGACYHGGLEGVLQQQSLAGADEATIQTALFGICNTVKDQFSQLLYQCYHGLGHALMLLTGGDVPKSLAYCDTLGASEKDSKCYEGVFMENLPGTSTQEHPPKYIKADDPLYPCDAIKDTYKDVCYAFQTSYFIYLAPNNWPKVASFCALLPEAYQTECFMQIGTSAPGSAHDVASYYAICKQLPVGAAQQACVIGVINSYFDRYPGDIHKLAESATFCAQVNVSYKIACYGQIGSLSQNYPGTNNRELVCGQIAQSSYKKVCLNK